MSKLKELEKRLRDEPENLGLRVMLAGALDEAGRRGDAVELYRSVAIAYREQGRTQQAILVCRSILELVPDDVSCQALLAAMVASQAPPSQAPSIEAPAASVPVRRSSFDATPLPPPLPYHVVDPTMTSQPWLARADLPPSLRGELDRIPEISGIANAARLISESLIAASRERELADGDDALDDDASLEPETGKIPRFSATELDTIADLPPAPAPEVLDDDLTLPPTSRIPGAGIDDDDLTLPVVSRVPRARSLDDDRTAPRGLPIRKG